MTSLNPALDAALTDLCRRLGLSPWEVLHRPRLHVAQVRRRWGW